MPGVPSGRGCEACRKQKKKCDQAKPACGRCARLKIACVGAGVQRYQFKAARIAIRGANPNFGAEWDSSAPSSSTPSPPKDGQQQQQQQQQLQQVILASKARPQPILETVRLTHAFISMFRGEDLRYDMNAFGIFLHGVPRRLGHNPALDATAAALVRTHSSFRTGVRDDPAALAAFVKALQALRVCLDDPVTASSPDTLCAIYLLFISHSWLDPARVNTMNHGEAMSYILRQSAKKRFKGKFEKEMIITLTIPVFLDALVNPRIKLGPWLFELVDLYMSGDDPALVNPNRSCDIRNLVRIPAIVQDPVGHMPYMGLAHITARRDALRLREAVIDAELAYIASIGTALEGRSRRIWGLTQLEYGAVLALTMLFAGILVAHDPDDVDESGPLADQLALYRAEALALAGNAEPHRPMGTGYMSLVLVMAWATAEDPAEMAVLWAALEDYVRDFPSAEWQHRPSWVRNIFGRVKEARMARLLEAAGDTFGLELSGNWAATEVPVAKDTCVIL